MQLGRLATVTLMILSVVLLAGCSGDSVPPSELLLGPADFPGQSVIETRKDRGETSLDEATVQVELTGSDFVLLESLVLFETENLAQSILSGIKQDQISQGTTAQPVQGFEDNSGVIEDQLHADEASTVFFIQGRALVRITLTGPKHQESVWEIARLARDKSDSL